MGAVLQSVRSCNKFKAASYVHVRCPKSSGTRQKRCCFPEYVHASEGVFWVSVKTAKEPHVLLLGSICQVPFWVPIFDPWPYHCRDLLLRIWPSSDQLNPTSHPVACDPARDPYKALNNSVAFCSTAKSLTFSGLVENPLVGKTLKP